jgi:hypothetical protein
MEELPEIPVRLNKTGAATTLDAFLRFEDETLQQWSEQQDTENLADLENEVRQDHAASRERDANSRSEWNLQGDCSCQAGVRGIRSSSWHDSS